MEDDVKDLSAEEIRHKVNTIKSISEIAVRLIKGMPDDTPFHITFAGLLAGRYENVSPEEYTEAVFRDGTLMAAFMVVSTAMHDLLHRVEMLEMQIADMTGHPSKTKMH